MTHCAKRLGFVLLFTVLCLNLLKAQRYNPTQDPIFKEGEVASIYVLMDSSDFAFLMDVNNAWNDAYLRCNFRFVNSELDTTLPYAIGIRLRGNTSRTHPKRSFKFRFNEFPEGEKVFNHKAFNLKAQNNDPTHAREFLSLHLYRAMNVPAARAHHTRLYINQQYMGLYLNVEQIDDEFIDTRFGHELGNLYKCSYGADLTTNNDVYNNGIFELETFQHLNDRAWLQEFVFKLNTLPINDFEAWINDGFNVTVFAKYLALEAVLGHWDGYSYNQNNFYLFENQFQQHIEFIPYDLDNTFGINWIPRDWATRDVMDWASDNRPLTNRLMQLATFRNQYITAIDALLDQFFNEDYLFPKMDSLQSLLRPHIAADTFYTKTFGFDSASFEIGYTAQAANHAPYGLKPFVSIRNQSARAQIGGITAGLNPFNWSNNIKVYQYNAAELTVIIEDFAQPINCNLYSSSGQLVYQSRLENSANNIPIALLNTGLYLLQFEVNGNSQTLKWLKAN